jgi:hypothetical protein
MQISVLADNKEGRALFPRLEYTNEWTPVGRGDPLKDPTFDYMPPMLDRVRYWGEGSSSKNKNDILLLGVPSKKQHAAKKEKFTYGPIKRTYYSGPNPYQSHFSSPHHHQQQQQQQYVTGIYPRPIFIRRKITKYLPSAAPAANNATTAASHARHFRSASDDDVDPPPQPPSSSSARNVEQQQQYPSHGSAAGKFNSSEDSSTTTADDGTDTASIKRSLSADNSATTAINRNDCR